MIIKAGHSFLAESVASCSPFYAASVYDRNLISPILPGSALRLSLSLSFHLRRSPSAPRSAVAAPTHTGARARTHTCIQQKWTETHSRAHLPLPAVSLFSANVAKCLHFCITATINLPSLLFLLSPSCTSFSCPPLLFFFFFNLSSPALCHHLTLSFCPLFIILCFSDLKQVRGLRVGIKKNLKFSLSSCARFLLHILCLPSFSSLSSPALPYFYHSMIHSNPLLSSSFIPLFYMHPLLLLLTSPLLPPVLYLLLSYYFYPDPFFSLSSPVLSFSPLGSRFGLVLKNCPAT